MKLYFKYPQNLNGYYTETEDKIFTITDSHYKDNGLCEEYEIIEKINKNENNYFDFSKAIIDIGSEDGGYAINCNFSKAYCFEPNKKMCCLIWANMYLNNKVYTTEVFNTMLGDKDGEIVTYNGFAQEGSGIYIQSMDRGNGPQQVKKYTLDSFNIQNVGFIKIDTEGFDYYVIKGAKNTIISNNYPPILFECWPIGFLGQTQEYYDKLVNLLTSFGYIIFFNWGDHETHLAVKLNN